MNRPKLVHEFVKITQDCHDHGYEGIFVDEPTIQECFCPICQELFESVASISELDILGTDPYWLTAKGMGMEDACKYARLLKKKCKEKNKSSQTERETTHEGHR